MSGFGSFVQDFHNFFAFPNKFFRNSFDINSFSRIFSKLKIGVGFIQ